MENQITSDVLNEIANVTEAPLSREEVTSYTTALAVWLNAGKNEVLKQFEEFNATQKLMYKTLTDCYDVIDKLQMGAGNYAENFAQDLNTINNEMSIIKDAMNNSSSEICDMVRYTTAIREANYWDANITDAKSTEWINEQLNNIKKLEPYYTGRYDQILEDIFRPMRAKDDLDSLYKIWKKDKLNPSMLAMCSCSKLLRDSFRNEANNIYNKYNKKTPRGTQKVPAKIEAIIKPALTVSNQNPTHVCRSMYCTLEREYGVNISKLRNTLKAKSGRKHISASQAIASDKYAMECLQKVVADYIAAEG